MAPITCTSASWSHSACGSDRSGSHGDFHTYDDKFYFPEDPHTEFDQLADVQVIAAIIVDGSP